MGDGAIDVRAGERFTQVFLGKVQHADLRGTHHLPTDAPTYTKWMHSVLYLWYVSPDDATEDSVPRSGGSIDVITPLDAEMRNATLGSKNSLTAFNRLRDEFPTTSSAS